MGMEVDDRRERLNLAEAQYQASSTIYGTSDPVEILNAVVNFGGKAFAEAHLALLDPDTQILNIIAIRDGDGIRAALAGRRPEEYPAFETLSAVEVLHVADVTTDPFLTEQERARAQANGIGAMLLIPLVVAQRLTGLIGFTNPTPLDLPQHVLRAMRNLGDQIAVVFENQALLRSTAATLDEVQSLYDINREMLGALDPLAVLRVLREHLAKSASAITHAVVDRGADDAETVTIRYIATRTAEQAVEIPLDGLNLTTSAFGDPAESASVVFVEDVEKSESPLHRALQLKDARSYIIIVVRERGVIDDILAVAYDRAEVFDSRTRRLFNAVADQIGIVLQNQRLLDNARSAAYELAQQVQVLQGLNRLSSGISSFHSERELLDYATESLTTALGVDHVGIVLFEPQEDLGTVVSEYPDHGAVGSKIETRNSAMITTLLAAPDRPVVIQDVSTAELIEPDTREILNRIGVVSMMIMALQSAGQIVGTVGFDLYSRARQITPTMIETAETMIGQIAIGLQNQRLLGDAQRRADQLQHVASFGQEMQSALKLDAILTIMLTESRVMLPIDRMSIAFFDQRQAQLRVVGQYEDDKISVDVENGPLLATNGAFVGQVWETGEMIAIADTHAASSTSGSQDISVRSVMVAPIRSRGKSIGTVNVGSLRPYSYTETDNAIFLQMINQLAIAIENADAYRQSQRVAQNEALINDIATHFQQHSAVEDMLQIAVDELGRALGARRGRIRLSLEGEGKS